MTNIIVIIRGGICTAVLSDGSKLTRVEVLDYDAEGLESDELLTVPNPEGGTEEAYRYEGEVFAFEPIRVKELIETIDKKLKDD